MKQRRFRGTVAASMSEKTYWQRCNSCDAELDYGQTYWVCSVSTCTRKRTGMRFCSVSCWEAHLPMMRHREAWAVEEKAPSEVEWRAMRAAEEADEPRLPTSSSREVAPARREVAPAVRRRVIGDSENNDQDAPRDVLVVVSKLKKYVRARSGMNTSDGVTDLLSDHLRSLCNKAIRVAAQEGRKTVLDRDFAKVLEGG